MSRTFSISRESVSSFSVSARWWAESCRADVRHWTCPYCERQNQGAFPGGITWVTKQSNESKVAH
jgi:hypothetical protein